MTEYLAVEGSTSAYEVAGSGALIADALPSGLGRLALTEGAGRYAHDQYPGRVVALVLAFFQPDAACA